MIKIHLEEQKSSSGKTQLQCLMESSPWKTLNKLWNRYYLVALTSHHPKTKLLHSQYSDRLKLYYYSPETQKKWIINSFRSFSGFIFLFLPQNTTFTSALSAGSGLCLTPKLFLSSSIPVVPILSLTSSDSQEIASV